MEKLLRSLLLKTIGTEHYLAFVSQVYIRLIKAGFLQSKYPELFYLKQLIKPGFVCIDIGANVGYYSTMLSPLCGDNGQVHAVEPVQLFQKIFEKNSKIFGCNNIQMHPVALGGQSGQITMGTPIIDGVFRHGLTHVVESHEDISQLATYQVDMCVPVEIFGQLTRLDFVKCDVEGYEVILMPHLMPLLKQFKPIIQIEISTVANRTAIIELLAQENYKPLKLIQGELVEMNSSEAIQYDGGDFYFKTS